MGGDSALPDFVRIEQALLGVSLRLKQRLTVHGHILVLLQLSSLIYKVDILIDLGSFQATVTEVRGSSMLLFGFHCRDSFSIFPGLKSLSVPGNALVG